ncbi:hypothetical protein SEA_KELA_86 [Streptomyces phage Kela]|jgi:hypothetical protein|nr:hypothetical protein SEA_JUSTBECAUSE_85 [Streptomyces phage JustBecause]QJD53657.1 hypothetical protein SEA_KELA_86 [Streptomyces phage Kela]
MAGRPKSEQGDEKRDKRIVARFTESERSKIDEARKILGLKYEVDVVRNLALQAVDDLLVSHRENVAE